MISNNPCLKSLRLPCQTEVSNRIFKSAMSEGFADSDHAPNHLHENLYARFAEGNSGIVVTGNVMVDGSALGEPGNVVIEDERHLDALKRWAQKGQTETSHLWVQLNHPGKQSPRFVSKHPVAPSAIPLKGGMARAFKKPRALSDNEIQNLVKKFATSAGIVQKAGFKGVQIHAAHGYLISQFLSPQHNHRAAPYGGSLENRMRFLLEIYEAMRIEVGPHFPIGVKMNIDDFIDGGFSKEDSLKVIQALELKGLDLIELSGGTYEKPVMMGQEDKEGFFLDLVREIKTQIRVPLVITGGFRSLSVMDSVIKKEEADMIGLARPLVIDPDIPLKIAAGTFETIKLPRISLGLKPLTKALGSVLGLGAYEVALKDLAEGKPVRIKKNGWGLVFKLLWIHGIKALIKRRSK